MTDTTPVIMMAGGIGVLVGFAFGFCFGKVVHYPNGVLEGQRRQHRKHEEQRLLDQQTNIGNRIYKAICHNFPSLTASSTNGPGTEPYNICVRKKQGGKAWLTVTISIFAPNHQIEVWSEGVEWAGFLASSSENALRYINDKLTSLIGQAI
jgi:hypothetical protein